MPENLWNDAIDNLVETLIYERIGAYMRKNLINMYRDEDWKFNEKVKKLYRVYKSDIKQFNQALSSAFKTDITPGKSAQILKVFFRCQIPYEMFVIPFFDNLFAYSLHCTRPS